MSTYKIKRFFQSFLHDTEVIETGLTLEDAQAHCKSPESSSRTATSAEAQQRTDTFGPWFDGFEEEA